MSPRSSLTGRVALSSALAACLAALVAAAATSALAGLLLQGAEDRRLLEAAVILAAELGEGGAQPERVSSVLHEEIVETRHTGVVFAVFGAQGQWLAGDHRIERVPGRDCAFVGQQGGLRVCQAVAANGLKAAAGAARTNPTSLFVVSALLAALLAGAAAWLLSWPMSRMVVAPLARLTGRLARLNVDSATGADLGPSEQVTEVDQLRDALKQLLTRVNEAIEQARRFAANAAHELRTPLTSVRAELELLAESNVLGDEPRARLAHVDNRVAELTLLVERLLVLATPRQKQGDRLEMVSIRDLVEDVVASLPPTGRPRVAFGEPDVLTRGDAVLLGTLLTNAVSNALKFGTSASISVRTEGTQAVIDVDDDGPGVETGQRERVFEPFFRGERALRGRVAGHGLGLALVRHIAETHGGSAEFVDKVGAGARLRVCLPLAF